MNGQVEQIIRDYIPDVIHLSLATSYDNKPWVCEVHFAYDDDLDLYFISSTTTRHVQELEENPQVAGNIVAQHQKDEKPRGVYFEGAARKVSGTGDEAKAKEVYSARFGEDRVSDFLANDSSLQFFQIIADTFYLFDRRGEMQGKHALTWKGKKR